MKSTISAILLPLACALPLAACGNDATSANPDEMASDEEIGETTEDAADRAMLAAEKAIDASASAAEKAGEKVGDAAGRAGTAVRDATKDAAGSASEEANRIAADAQAE